MVLLEYNLPVKDAESELEKPQRWKYNEIIITLQLPTENDIWF